MNLLSSMLIWLLIQAAIPTGMNQHRENILIDIKYLGHSSFYMDFGGEISLVTDYGKSDAYKEYGWSSPIRSMGDECPDILTYSHMHDDHYDAERAENCEAVKYFGDSVLCYKGLSIKPIHLSEKDISIPDSYACLFEYRNMKVLHLGDCQANIMAIRDPGNRKKLLEKIPSGCQVVFVPVEGPTQFTEELIQFIRLLDTEIIVPMHYWSEEYKDSFLNEFSSSSEGAGYEIVDLPGDTFTYDPAVRQAIIRVLDFNRGL